MLSINNTYKKLKKSYSKNLPEVLALKRKQYPQFVFESNPKTLKDEIPVFTLHSVYPDRFEEQLQFLNKNNYKTLTADEFYECITGSKTIPERAILLTFDDGWKNLYTVVYPLLKKYKMFAVCFIIPGLVSLYGENEEELNKSKPKSEERIRDSQTLCNWGEIKEMHESGVIDFQSHSMYHDLIYTSRNIEDFFYPDFDDYPLNINVPIYIEDRKENISRNASFGAPIYRNTSRFAGKKRYFDDENLRNECIEYVALQGGVNFFRKNSWRKELLNIVRNYKEKYPESGYFENDAELRESLFFELKESKVIIEEKLAGKMVNHFCFPWWIGSDLASEVSKEAGYLANFWGVLPKKRTNKRGDNPYRVSRLLSEDYIFNLPGDGRKSLSKVLQEKFLLNQKRFKEKLFKTTI